MFVNENEYEIRKKYCPSYKRNVFVRVYHGVTVREECSERDNCNAKGGCTNAYLQSEDKESHSS